PNRDVKFVLGIEDKSGGDPVVFQKVTDPANSPNPLVAYAHIPLDGVGIEIERVGKLVGRTERSPATPITWAVPTIGKIISAQDLRKLDPRVPLPNREEAKPVVIPDQVRVRCRHVVIA